MIAFVDTIKSNIKKRNSSIDFEIKRKSDSRKVTIQSQIITLFLIQISWYLNGSNKSLTFSEKRRNCWVMTVAMISETHWNHGSLQSIQLSISILNKVKIWPWIDDSFQWCWEITMCWNVICLEKVNENFIQITKWIVYKCSKDDFSIEWYQEITEMIICCSNTTGNFLRKS